MDQALNLKTGTTVNVDFREYTLVACEFRRGKRTAPPYLGLVGPHPVRVPAEVSTDDQGRTVYWLSLLRCMIRQKDMPAGFAGMQRSPLDT